MWGACSWVWQYFYIVISSKKNTSAILFGDTVRLLHIWRLPNYNKIPSSPLQYATVVLHIFMPIQERLYDTLRITYLKFVKQISLFNNSCIWGYSLIGNFSSNEWIFTHGLWMNITRVMSSTYMLSCNYFCLYD